MRSSSNELYQLIWSMTKTEKRYFKLYAEQNTLKANNNYLKLYDAVEKQVHKDDGYEEDKIIKKFKNETFVKYLPSTKYQLYKLILKCMHQYNGGSSVEAELAEMMHNVEYLRGKRLFDQAWKTLRNARKKAEKHERFAKLMDINIQELELIEEIVEPDQALKRLEKYRSELQSFAGKHLNYAEFKYLFNKAHMLQRKTGFARTAEELVVFNELLAHPLMRDISKAESKSATYFYYFAKVIGEYGVGNLENCYEVTAKLVEMMELYPFELQNDVNQLIDIVYNHLLVCYALNKQEEFLKYLQILRATKPKKNADHAKAFERYYMLYFNWYREHAEHADALEVMQQFELELQEHEAHLNPEFELVLFSECTHIYMSLQDYSKALRWNNKILNTRHLKLREDVQSLARIFDLMIHYELKHFDLLEYRLKSAYRYLYKKNRLHMTEKMILRSIRKLPMLNSNAELIKLFRELQEEIKTASNDPLEKRVLSVFDFITWLDEKVKALQ
jgi:hypothetical protein